MLVPVGQAQLVPTGTGKGQMSPLLIPWDKSNTHAQLVPVRQAQLVPSGTGKGQKRPLLTSHIPTLEAFPCPGTRSIPMMELVPGPLVPTCSTKWVYKGVEYLLFTTHVFGHSAISPFLGGKGWGKYFFRMIPLHQRHNFEVLALEFKKFDPNSNIWRYSIDI